MKKKIEQIGHVEKCLYFDKIDSTNKEAKRLGLVPKGGINVIWAGIQTSGRGRNDRPFFSSVAGGLWVTIVLAIKDISNHFQVNRSLSLAICEIATRAVPNAEIALKWPNDVYINDKKICGILLENIPGKTNGIAAGFGLNVNLKKDQFPPDVAKIATSLYIETGKEFDETAVLVDILKLFYEYMKTDVRIAHEKYRSLVYRKGSAVSIGDCSGTLHDVLPDGALCIKSIDGIRIFMSGDIVFLD